MLVQPEDDETDHVLRLSSIARPYDAGSDRCGRSRYYGLEEATLSLKAGSVDVGTIAESTGDSREKRGSKVSISDCCGDIVAPTTYFDVETLPDVPGVPLRLNCKVRDRAVSFSHTLGFAVAEIVQLLDQVPGSVHSSGLSLSPSGRTLTLQGRRVFEISLLG